MDSAQNARVLSLLPHMERPPDTPEAEWTELLLLEAPSLLGLALPGAEALDGSEPAFLSESGGGQFLRVALIAWPDIRLLQLAPR